MIVNVSTETWMLIRLMKLAMILPKKETDNRYRKRSQNSQARSEQGDPDSRVHGANMGPIWGRQDPGGPHVGPMNFAFWGQKMGHGTLRL